MEDRRRLRRELERKIVALESQSQLLRRVLTNSKPSIPEEYAAHPQTYDRIVLANERRGIDAQTTEYVFRNSSGVGRILIARIATALAVQGDELALLYRDVLQSGFHGGFGRSDAALYISDNCIFEKMLTRKLQSGEEEHAKDLLRDYLCLAQAA